MSDIPENTPEPPAEEGISLKGLSEAFAQAMGVPAGPPTEVEREEPEAGPVDAEPVDAEPADRPPEAEDQPPEEEDDSCPMSPKTILEAMFFVDNRENRPLESRRAAALMRGVEPEEIPELIGQLNGQYAAAGCPYQIVSEGSGYRMTLRESFEPLRKRFYGRVREARLSQAAIDVLAIVAYQQPLTAEKVTRLRGKSSGHILAQLVRRRLLRLQRSEGESRKVRYHTTDRFLDLFGLESLDDLPQSEELEEWPTDE